MTKPLTLLPRSFYLWLVLLLGHPSTIAFAQKWIPCNSPLHQEIPQLFLKLGLDTVLGATNEHVLVSYDSGLTWQVRDDGSALMGLPSTEPVFKSWCARNGIIVATRSDYGLSASKDGGRHWTDISGPFANSLISGFGISPDSKIVVGTRTVPHGPNGRGMFISSNEGYSWTQLPVSGVGLQDSLRPDVQFLGVGAQGTIFAEISGMNLTSNDLGASWNS